MDLDGDGIRDVITGSWPGELYVFKGTKDGEGAFTYAEPMKLTDKDGKDINTGNASALFATDWDRDGDIDLVVGSIDGWVWLVPNESGNAKLSFGTAVKVEADGKPIHEHHSGPTVADWDGNGTLDLIVGQGDGNVVWYANSERAGAPKLAAPEVLHASKNGGRSDGSHCGGRVKPTVVDWNGDGRLDLLLGDFGVKQPEKKQLSDEQAKELAALEAQQKLLMEKLRPLSQKITGDVLASLGYEVDINDSKQLAEVFQKLSDEERKTYSKAMGKAMQEHVEMQGLQAQLRALYKKLGVLKGRPTISGHVWLLLRESAEKQPDEAPEASSQD